MATPPANAAALFERYGPAIHRRCAGLLRDPEAAKDAVQEVFLRAHAHADRYRGDAAPFTWLYAIATTYCLQQLRNHQRRLAKLEALPPPEAARGDLDRRLDLVRLLAGEDEQTVTIAYLRFVDGLTLEETAELVGLSRKTVAKRLEGLKARSLARFAAEGTR